jgi:hypothetical protein
MEKVWTSCRDQCMDYLKSETTCELFCVFVEHIEKDHALEVLRLYLAAGEREEPLVSRPKGSPLPLRLPQIFPLPASLPLIHLTSFSSSHHHLFSHTDLGYE